MPSTRVQSMIRDAALKLYAEQQDVQLTVSDLAKAAGIARSTVYNNVISPENLFESVASRLEEEMLQQAVATFGDIEDPAMRTSMGMRLFIRRAQDEPLWGKFLLRFGLNDAGLESVLRGAPAVDIKQGIDCGRFTVSEDSITEVAAMVSGTTLSAMFLVLHGHRGWREAGSNAVTLVLRALGLDEAEARQLAEAELPPLRDI